MTLSEAEKADGLFLACKSQAITDCIVAPLLQEDSFEVTRIAGRIAAIERITNDVAVVRVQTEKRFSDYHPGQYANVVVGGFPAREYSFANPRGDEHLEFHIKKVNGGNVSSHIYDKAQIGDPISIVAPFGGAYFRPDTQGLLILVASGTGLAPIKAILHAASDANYDGEVHVYQAARNKENLYLVDEIGKLCAKLKNASLTQVVADPGAQLSATDALVSLLDSRYSDLADASAYLCGSPDTVEACRNALGRKHLPRERCYADAFVMRAPPTQEPGLSTLSG
jgi:NAD(P)H-flavin reductase